MSSFLKDPNPQLFLRKGDPPELISAVDLRSKNGREPSCSGVAANLRDGRVRKERTRKLCLWALLLLTIAIVMMARWYGITFTGNYT